MSAKGSGKAQKMLPEIIEYRENGFKNTEIAKHLGIATSTISRLYNEHLKSIEQKKDEKLKGTKAIKKSSKPKTEKPVKTEEVLAQPEAKVVVIHDEQEPQVRFNKSEIPQLIETRTSTIVSQDRIHTEESRIQRFPSVERYVDKKAQEDIKKDFLESKKEVFVYNVFLHESIVPKVCRSTLTLRKLLQSNPDFIIFEGIAIHTCDISYIELSERINQ